MSLSESPKNEKPDNRSGFLFFVALTQHLPNFSKFTVNPIFAFFLMLIEQPDNSGDQRQLFLPFPLPQL
jgi:hypothetical protein